MQNNPSLCSDLTLLLCPSMMFTLFYICEIIEVHDNSISSSTERHNSRVIFFLS